MPGTIDVGGGGGGIPPGLDETGGGGGTNPLRATGGGAPIPTGWGDAPTTDERANHPGGGGGRGGNETKFFTLGDFRYEYVELQSLKEPESSESLLSDPRPFGKMPTNLAVRLIRS
jgi:hypothetical protein